ncbi:MAG: type I pullulanase, partial [Bacillota bacterium]
RLTGDFDFKYYTFNVTNNGVTNEVTDPYAYSTGANGQRGMIVNFEETNPEGWTYNTRPNNIQRLTDYIVWELHVRDLTTHSSWNGNESYRGKFMGMTETGTTYSVGDETVSTGLDHIVELGVNAVQLLPIFDFGYVDEVQVATNSLYTNVFNWGYMPYHFNTLEGSYSTNPFDGAQRIREFKEVVMAFHAQDIRIIMDVVYNHTGESEGSNFHKIVPGYYHRLNTNGGFSNGSGTGNETASERSMMRKFMIDSLHFWATEYNLSGFRFDLMELHDVETMNQIQAMLEEIDPTIVVYGEPWMGGSSPLPTSVRAGKDNLDEMNNVGAFNDITRDAVKGSVFQAAEKGWVQGNTTEYTKQGIMYGILGGIEHSSLTQITEWHKNPNQMINYVTAHDNNTLFDKLRLSGISATKAPQMVIQSNAIILTSQGISFLHAGVEFARSKPLPEGGYDHNSYESPDIVNQLRWDRKLQYNEVFEYYKALIQIRKTYNHFRIDSASEITDRLTFLTTDQPLKNIAYQIAGRVNEPDIIVAHVSNPTGGLSSVELPAGKTYTLLTNTLEANPKGIETVSGTLYIPANTTMILVEVTNETPSVTIKEAQVQINVGQTFDPASNVTINNPNATIYYSTFHNTNISGRYIVTVSVQETYGKVTHYTYQLIVGTPPFNVTISRG